MKHFFLLAVVFLLPLFAKAQLSYTGGPESYNITHLAARGDSLLAVTNNQVYLNSARGSKQWSTFSQGLYSKDSLVRAFNSFKGGFLLAQGNKVFTLTKGNNRWQDLSKGIQAGHLVNLFLNLQDRELLARAYDAVQRQYFWYHYDESKQEWLYIDPKAVVGFSPPITILPNGNILAYTTGTYRARFNAGTREWRRIDTLNVNVFNSVIALSNTELLAGATTSGTIYRSIDGGKVWTTISPAPIAGTGGSVSLYKSNKAIYAVATEYVGQSIDGGKTWKEVNDFAFIAASSPFVGNDSSSYVVARGIPFVHFNTPNLEGAFSIELNPPFYCNNLLFARDNLFLYGQGGIFAFDATAEEPEISSYAGNLPTAPVTATILAKAGPDLVALTSNFGFYRKPATANWQLSMQDMELYLPYLASSRAMATRQDTVIVFDGFYSAYYSTNRGQSWKECDYTPYLFSFQGFANGRKHLYAGYDRELYRWAGNRLDWEELKRPGNNSPVSGILVKGDTLIVNASAGWFYTLDEGQQWKSMVSPNNLTGFYVNTNGKAYVMEGSSSFAAARLFEINAAGTAPQRVLLTTPIGIGISNVAIQDSLMFATLLPNQGYIYFSTNSGKSWKPLNTQAVGYINNVFFDGDKVYLGGTAGVWSMPIKQLTTGIFTPEPFALNTLEVSPNPGSGLFRITDPGKEIEGTLQVKVFNTLGQLIKTQNMQVWNASLELDLSQEAPGQYLILMSNKEKAWSAKLIKY